MRRPNDSQVHFVVGTCSDVMFKALNHSWSEQPIRVLRLVLTSYSDLQDKKHASTYFFERIIIIGEMIPIHIQIYLFTQSTK